MKRQRLLATVTMLTLGISACAQSGGCTRSQLSRSRDERREDSQLASSESSTRGDAMLHQGAEPAAAQPASQKVAP